VRFSSSVCRTLEQVQRSSLFMLLTLTTFLTHGRTVGVLRRVGSAIASASLASYFPSHHNARHRTRSATSTATLPSLMPLPHISRTMLRVKIQRRQWWEVISAFVNRKAHRCSRSALDRAHPERIRTPAPALGHGAPSQASLASQGRDFSRQLEARVHAHPQRSVVSFARFSPSANSLKISCYLARTKEARKGSAFVMCIRCVTAEFARLMWRCTSTARSNMGLMSRRRSFGWLRRFASKKFRLHRRWIYPSSNKRDSELEVDDGCANGEEGDGDYGRGGSEDSQRNRNHQQNKGRQCVYWVPHGEIDAQGADAQHRCGRRIRVEMEKSRKLLRPACERMRRRQARACRAPFNARQ
jgi:hypothetical protein